MWIPHTDELSNLSFREKYTNLSCQFTQMILKINKCLMILLSSFKPKNQPL